MNITVLLCCWCNEETDCEAAVNALWQGIGRKVMSKYGWREGQSLGSSVRGIVDALDAEGGQKPGDKRGFGYE